MDKHEGLRRRKLTLFGLIVFLIGGGFFYQNFFLLLLSEILTLLLFISWFYLYLSLKALEVERISPERAFENQKVIVTLRITYPFFLPLRWVYIRDFFGPDHSPLREFLIPHLSRGDREIQYTAQCHGGRGQFSLGPLEVIGLDPLGIWKGKAIAQEITKFPVLPELIPLAHFWGQGTQTPFFAGAKTVHKAGVSHDFLGTREYRPGDSLKYIHWPATAHMGKPIIKEFQSHTSSRITFFIDLSEKALQGFKPNTLDYSIKIIGSLAKNAAENQQEFRLIGQGDRPYTFPFGKGPGHLAWILEEMALMKPLGQIPLEEVLTRSLPLLEPGEEVILVASSHVMDPQRYINGFTILQAKEIHLSVILLVSPSFEKLWATPEGDFLITEELPALLAARGIRVVAVEKGVPILRCFEKEM